MQENDDDEEEKFEPKTQTENTGDGGGSNRPTRVGASTPDDSRRRREIGGSGKIRKLGRRPQPAPQMFSAEDNPVDSSKSVELRGELEGSLTVKELAKQLGVSDTTVIKQLFMMGYPRTVSQTIDMELAREYAIHMGYTINEPDAENSAENEL